MKLNITLAAFASLGLTACNQTLQGASHAQYTKSQIATALEDGAHSDINFDAELRALSGEVKPVVFPARMGLARIDKGAITALPETEAIIWREAATWLGDDFGSFAALNTFTAGADAGADVMARVRRAANQQGLDYVLVYSVNAEADTIGTAFSLLNLTIVGAYVVPTRDIEAQVTLSAAFIDVASGHIHATFVGHGQDRGVAPAHRAKRAKAAFVQEAIDTAVIELALEADQTLRQLAERDRQHAAR